MERIRKLGDLPTTPYLEFLLKDSMGQRALENWVEIVTNLLNCDPNNFFKFQTNVGYDSVEIDFTHFAIMIFQWVTL